MRIHRLVLLLFLGAVAGLAEPARAAAPFLLADVNATGLDRTAAAAVSGTFLPLGRLTLVPMSEPGSGREMWVTDGTDAGTRPLLDLCPGPCGTEIIPLGVVGRAGIFLARPGQSPMALWKSDGTLLGTFPLFTRHRIETCRAGEPPGTAILGSTLFFSARYQGGCELWTTDGTAAGTRSLREITPADIGSHVLHELIAVGDRVFFVAADLLDWGLWRSDGTPEGTIRLRGWSQEKPFSLVVAGARLFFLAKEEETDVWTSDGTPAGTRRITQSLHPGLLREIDGSVYFTADEGTSGREIWRTDAAATSPRPVTRFANASPFVGTWSIEKLGNRLLFGANDGLNGLRLWTTDGRPESTAPLTGCPGGCPLLASDTVLVRSGPDILFKSSQGTVCGLLEQPGNDLWASDGTGAGTRRLADFCPCCLVSGIRPFRGGNLFALQESDTSDPDLWVSDATPRGTRLLRSGASIGHVEEGGPGLLAIFDRAAERMQLWTSDGTAEPTRQVTGIGRNGWSSQPRELVPAGDGIRFQAYQPTFFRLWESHGTPETTAPSAGDVWGHLVPFKDLTLGWAYEGVMRTDGTAAGSFRLTPEGAGEAENLAVLGDRAVFLMRTFDGTSLWKTDGTVEGTRKLLDLPGSGRHLRPLGAEAVFVVGGALWKTDGTTAGTRPLT
ncbi:MAG TPA: hypothetical protein DD490_12760, partial [Acidobacteria bacterium]|nr:hypothetical protein [Acidobacteriota bacterium]